MSPDAGLCPPGLPKEGLVPQRPPVQAPSPSAFEEAQLVYGLPGPWTRPQPNPHLSLASKPPLLTLSDQTFC